MTATLPTTVRVISRVHDNATDGWADTTQACATSFTDFDILVLFVTNRTKAGATVNVNHSDFTTRQFNLGIGALFSDQLGAIASTAN